MDIHQHTNHVNGLYGNAEFSAACGVSRQTLSNWMARCKCPQPDYRLKAGPVWRLTPELARFIISKGGKI